MAKHKFKVWVQIEEVDPEGDYSDNITEEDEVGCFDTEAEAFNFVGQISDIVPEGPGA